MDDVIGRLAERQHGLVLRAQALAAGFTPAAVQHRLDAGRWELVRAGVYRLPGSPPTWEQRLLAVVLGAGTGAVASHRTAAALWGLAGFCRDGVFDVTTPRCRRPRHPSGRLHRSLHLPASHTGRVSGIPVTCPARTLVDLAGAVKPGRTERAVDNALAMGLVTTRELHAVTGTWDNRRVAAGWRPVRFTWHMVTAAPADVLDILRRSGVGSQRPGRVG